LDVLIHECIHVNVEYCLGGSTGPTSESGGPKKVKHVDEGNVPFDYVAGSPYALRRHRLDYYMHAPLPFESVMADATIGSVV
jgi:hypothetical protein